VVVMWVFVTNVSVVICVGYCRRVERSRIFMRSFVLCYCNAKIRYMIVGLLLICFVSISFSRVLHQKVHVMSNVDYEWSLVNTNNTMSVTEKYACCTLQVVR
jgi:hypothetical protein